MNKLVDHLLVLEGGGSVKDYPGNYTEYIHSEDSLTQSSQLKQKEEPTPKVPREKKRLSYHEKREFESLENQIEELEKRKTELNSLMNSGITDYNTLQLYSSELNDILKQLDEKSNRWLELAELT